MLEVGVETIPGGSWAATNAHWYGLQPSFNPGIWSISQIWANKCGGNGMVMGQSACPQHMNIVKHIV